MGLTGLSFLSKLLNCADVVVLLNVARLAHTKYPHHSQECFLTKMNILADQSLSLKLQSYNTESTTLKSCKTFNCLTHPLFNAEENPGQDVIKLSTGEISSEQL